MVCYLNLWRGTRSQCHNQPALGLLFHNPIKHRSIIDRHLIDQHRPESCIYTLHLLELFSRYSRLHAECGSSAQLSITFLSSSESFLLTQTNLPSISILFLDQSIKKRFKWVAQKESTSVFPCTKNSGLF